MLKGIGASPGIGIGRVLLIREHNLSYTPRQVNDVQAELFRLREAVESFCTATQAKADNMEQSVGEKEAEILRGHALMIQDPYMTGEIEKLIEGGQCAESALEAICDMFVNMFSSAEDDLTNQRAADVRDVKEGILRILLGIEETDISDAPPNTILVAKELTPSMTAGIHKENVVGIITEIGSKTSHSAILARALEIPAVLSVENATQALADKQDVIIDGGEGTVISNPEVGQVTKYERLRDEFIKEREALRKFIGRDTRTADGRRVELVANIGNHEEARKALDCDAEGVGLFRTEFLFMDKTSLPSEEEQFEAYKKAALIMKGRPVIIRTLDIGGDKEIPYLGLKKEENPFLGFRAVRFCLKRPDVFKPQLRALLRASAFGDVRMMLPLVTCVDEVTAVKALVKECMEELDREQKKYNPAIKTGVMMETSAASLIADLLAKEADFFSIGTNDLTQYTMCVDRGNASVSYLYSHYNPAVLRSIKRIIECGRKEGIPVGMCGEAAADALLIPLLISFGLDEYSVSPTAVLSTRKAISLWSKKDADVLAQRVMELKTEEEVLSCLKENRK